MTVGMHLPEVVSHEEWLGVCYRPNWPLEITGVFAQVAEEAEIGSSDSKLSPLSV
jgi:hypothetical protein